MQMDIMLEANLGIEECRNGTLERNATILCIQTDYAFHYQYLPRPMQLFRHLNDQHRACIIRE